MKEIGDLIDILKLGRLHFSGAGLLLFFLGSLLALKESAVLEPLRLITVLLSFSTGHLSVSYSNEYFDRKTDKKGKNTLFTGGSGVLLQKPYLSGITRKIASGLILLSVASALVAVVGFGVPWFFLIVVLLGNAVGWFYSAPPLEFSYNGIGEVATAFGAGILMPLVGYMGVSDVPSVPFLLMMIPLISSGFGFILSVQIPDIEGDRNSRKNTLASRVGWKKSLFLVLLFFAASSASLFGSVWLSLLSGFSSIALASLLPVTVALLSYALANKKSSSMFAIMNLGALFTSFLIFDLLLILGY